MLIWFNELWIIKHLSDLGPIFLHQIPKWIKTLNYADTYVYNWLSKIWIIIVYDREPFLFMETIFVYSGIST